MQGDRKTPVARQVTFLLWFLLKQNFVKELDDFLESFFKFLSLEENDFFVKHSSRKTIF